MIIVMVSVEVKSSDPAVVVIVIIDLSTKLWRRQVIVRPIQIDIRSNRM